ncbi:AMP-binding protein [Cellulomonas chengniuliangii]|uniref:AMP-binding protein n=1 Tax=Cellulomonas chengniuliangii TaxID=2968084 RepID=A0ABY5KUJ6_9CELL|nr:AMP-binding protein [Cellulomonas chengniuliangii]MCC2309142.1 AMP-binding protein [Cellulomonas chengniuliangii]UUI74142.1 AMP-binding protein [Cellulomonas chengniuliangii]
MRPTPALPWLASYADGVPATITPPDEPLTDSLYRAAERFPDRVAVDFEGKATTYRELLDEVERAAGALLALGVQHGDRVAIALPNCHTHVVAFWAVLRLGAIVVEHNPTYSAVELEHQLADSGAVAAICWEPTAARVAEVQQNTQLRHLIAVDLTRDLPRTKRIALTLPVPAARKQRAALRGPTPAGALEWHRLVADAKPVSAAHPAASADDVATIQYTGGTTGTPKGAVLTHRTLGSNAVQGAAWTQFKDGTETIYGVLPFFHAFGLTLCLTFAARIGATLVAFGKFDPAGVLAAQRRRPATFLPGVAPMFDRLSALAEKTGADLSTIRISLAGAMPISRATAERWEKLTGGLLIEGYGLTETGPVALGNPCTADRRPGALGLPFPSTEIRVVDQDDPTVDVEPGERGELLIRGPQVFSGYWNRPSENADQLLPDGWLRTGDVVVVDEHGFATLVDRIKEMIVTGGFKVYPSQVESHLRSMPGVADVAVVGIPGGDMGEKVVAAVVLDPSASPNIDLAAVREWCGQRLARYAVPRELVIVADLPRSQIGKVLRRVVREQVLTRA